MTYLNTQKTFRVYMAILSWGITSIWKYRFRWKIIIYAPRGLSEPHHSAILRKDNFIFSFRQLYIIYGLQRLQCFNSCLKNTHHWKGSITLLIIRQIMKPREGDSNIEGNFLCHVHCYFLWAECLEHMIYWFAQSWYIPNGTTEVIVRFL